MKTLHGNEKGFTLIEVLIAVTVGVGFLWWILPIMRNTQVARGYASLEMVQNDYYQKLNPVIEDIREASQQKVLWDKLVPTDAGYNPKMFPWFVIVDPGVIASESYVCYYFDDLRQALMRVQTQTPLDIHTTACSATVPGASERLVAAGLVTPTPQFPMFRGERDSFAIYFTLRVPMGGAGQRQAGALPSMLEIVRMGSVRS